VLPRRGVAAIYGKPGAFKSFLAMHLALCVAVGRPWAGRAVTKAPVIYIGAEGAAGLRKRKAGYVKAWAGSTLRAVAEQHIRERYFARIAEKAEPDEDKQKLADKQRQGFKRAIKSALDARTLIAKDHKGERILWLP
jgi:RecA/RadA recombinase